MDGFVLDCMKYWKADNELFVIIHYRPDLRAPGREVWDLRLASKENGQSLDYYGATISAVESLPDKTKVSFLDGVHLGTFGQKIDFNDPGHLTHSEAIGLGQILVLLSKAIEKEWKGESLPVNKIDSIEYPGSVAHFRAWMDRFLAVNGKTFKGTWEGHPLEYDIGYYTPAGNTTREVWNVYINQNVVINGKSLSDSHFAMILATEE
jgi:hypothetical protein